MILWSKTAPSMMGITKVVVYIKSCNCIFMKNIIERLKTLCIVA